MTDTIRSNKGFDLAYNEAHEQASWVVYILTREELEGGTEARTNNFRPDKCISTGLNGLKTIRASSY